IEVPVDDGITLVNGELFLQDLQRVRRRIDVRHGDRGGYTAGGALLRRGIDRVLVFEARLGALAVMRVHVDHARQDGTPARGDRRLRLGPLTGCVDARNEPSTDAD